MTTKSTPSIDGRRPEYYPKPIPDRSDFIIQPANFE